MTLLSFFVFYIVAGLMAHIQALFIYHLYICSGLFPGIEPPQASQQEGPAFEKPQSTGPARTVYNVSLQLIYIKIAACDIILFPYCRLLL